MICFVCFDTGGWMTGKAQN